MTRIYCMKEYFQCVCVRACVSTVFTGLVYGAQKTTFMSQLSFDSGFRGIKVRLSRLHGKCFYSLSHLPGPQGWDL